MFEVGRTPFFYTRVPGSYQYSPRTKRLNYTKFVEEAVHFSPKGSSVLDKNDNVDDYAHGDVNTTHTGWRNLMFNILGLPRKERLSKKKRGESGFKLFIVPE